MANLNGTSNDWGRPQSGRQVLAGQNPLIRAAAFLWFLVPGFFTRCGTQLYGHVFPLECFSSRDDIIRRMATTRIQIAKKRHDKQFLFNLNRGHRDPCDKAKEHSVITQFCKMLPPRRAWLRPGRSTRSKVSPKKITELSIVRAIEMARNKSPDWLRRLNTFIAEIQGRIRHANTIVLEAPRVVLVEKDKERKTYRPLATFSIPDQIIIASAANCLRQTIDGQMSRASYAFRIRLPGESRVRQHHDAVDDLRKFILDHKGKLLYVGECDIQKFFDTVNHEVARNALSEILRSVRDSGGYYDRRLKNIFDAYLHAYSYPQSVNAIAESKLLEMGKVGASVPWVREELERYYPDGIPESIGVPQGGALSPIIANIVLHVADKAVEQDAVKLGIKDYFYARYCDDMIIASVDEGATKALFAVYIQTLKKLRLPHHHPKKVDRYSKEYFDFKSKDVYPFGPPQIGATSPWIAFLGYHIRYDGKLRVRKSSLSKEIEKQVGIYRDVLRSVDVQGKKMRVSGPQAHHRARMRLIAMSVGSVGIQNYGSGVDHEMCWVNGFELLKKYPHAQSQLKILDRVRSRLLTKLRHRLLSVSPPQALELRSTRDVLRFYGRPFSYFAQFRAKP